MKVKLAKRKEHSPGPGAYTINRNPFDPVGYSFPKVNFRDFLLIFVPEFENAKQI